MMVARSVTWRRICPDEVERRIDEASQVTLYILHQTGPTGFVLKEEGKKKVKVLLGDPHMCSCQTFKKSHELCVHIIWLLLKKFRIPLSNPVVWQLGLVEREVSEILRGYLCRQSPIPQKSNSAHPVKIPQREIGPGDVCPICQDDLLGSARKVTYCRFGCGKSIHVKCMKIWADHQKSTGELTLRCPLCREDFGLIIHQTTTRLSRLTSLEQSHQHLGTVCSHCHVCPVVGKCYQCVTCASYYLCHNCFSSNQVHLLHSFNFRHHCSQPWRPAPHPFPSTPSLLPSDLPSLPLTVAQALQTRELTEDDYDLLLSLDNPLLTTVPNNPRPPVAEAPIRNHVTTQSRRKKNPGGVSERTILSLQVEPLDGTHPLILGGVHCPICHDCYVRGDWIKKLPCKHKFHRGCIDEWLHSHNTCPVDNQPLYHRNQQPLSATGQHCSSERRKVIVPLTRAKLVEGSVSHDPDGLGFSVSGQGIGSWINRAKNKKHSRHSIGHIVEGTCPPIQPSALTEIKTTSSPHLDGTDTTPLKRTLPNIRTSQDISATPILPLIGSAVKTRTDQLVTNSPISLQPHPHASSFSNTNLSSQQNDAKSRDISLLYVGSTSHTSLPHVEPAPHTSLPHMRLNNKNHLGRHLRKGLMTSTSGGNRKKHSFVRYTVSSSSLLDASLRISHFKQCTVPDNSLSITAAPRH